MCVFVLECEAEWVGVSVSTSPIGILESLLKRRNMKSEGISFFRFDPLNSESL